MISFTGVYMFKRFCKYLSFVTFLCFSVVHAETLDGPTKLTMSLKEDLNINGPATLKLVKAQNLTVNGSLDFSRLDVAKSAEIHGPVKGEKGKFGSLNVSGPLTANYIICTDLNVKGAVKVSYLDVKKDADITGSLEIQHGEFNQLQITSYTMVLDATTVEQDIVVRKGYSNARKTLHLKGETTIAGNITFESRKGIVIVEGPNVQIKGAIKGAKIQKVN